MKRYGIWEEVSEQWAMDSIQEQRENLQKLREHIISPTTPEASQLRCG
jgi:hypothetical protein